MKVCHITSGHSRYDARIFRKQCRTLAQNGIDTVLVCCDGKGEEKKMAFKLSVIRIIA